MLLIIGKLKKKGLIRFRNAQWFLLTILLFPTNLYASFIETTIGTAVVNDATATYHNPAALTLLPNPQIIPLVSVASFHTHFTGTTIQTSTGFTQSGSTSTHTNYYLPAGYFGMPVGKKVTIGLALVSNFFNRDIDETSILRYVQANNNVKNVDIVPAVGFKVNDFFSLGVGANFSYANFILKPTSGFPNLAIPDNQSRNECNGTGLGGDAGFLLKPTRSTLIGFNYRSAITYRLSGNSTFFGNPPVVSNNYRFNFWTPARSVLTINQFVTPTLGFIATVQRIQWSIFKNVHINGIATQVGPNAVIVNAAVPYYLHNAWLLTLGSHYRVTPKWIIRAAASYVQSPGNTSYQIANGDSVILGASVGYEINKNFTIDGSYAHAFMQNANIYIVNNRNSVDGVNSGSRDAVSVKLTINL